MLNISNNLTYFVLLINKMNLTFKQYPSREEAIEALKTKSNVYDLLVNGSVRGFYEDIQMFIVNRKLFAKSEFLTTFELNKFLNEREPDFEEV